jgi:DNA-binding helix-hairpin-helix protein with protein kinase domain
MTTIKYNGKITLDPKTLLVSGGEANVFKHGNLAFKIYHNPTKLHESKLKSFINRRFKLPNNLAYPIDILNDLQGKFVGFSMRIANTTNEFMKLSNRKYRNVIDITAPEILKLFSHVKTTLDLIHHQGLVVGDLNELNLMFNTNMQSIFIDVDSYQFDQYPC